MAIYHSDIQKRNFLLEFGRVCIIDFQHIGVLPQVFQTYAFFNIEEPFAHSVGRALGYQPSRAADSLVPISNVLQMCGRAHFGLCLSSIMLAGVEADFQLSLVDKRGRMI